jgi:hypothetical protein
MKATSARNEIRADNLDIIDLEQTVADSMIKRLSDSN